MHQFFTISILIILSLGTVQGQNKASNQEKTFRFRMGTGVSISPSSNQLKNHLRKNGFDDKSYGLFGSNDYPQSDGIPVVVEVALERKISQQAWLGLSLGNDQLVKVVGFDKRGSISVLFAGNVSIGHKITLYHVSWFLSPQITVDVPESNFTIFGGLSLDFHTLGLRWGESNAEKKKSMKVGIMVGSRVNIVAGLQWFCTYRWMQKLKYESSSHAYISGGNILYFNISEAEIGFSYFRTGLCYNFSW